VKSVADAHRARTIAQVLELPVADRIALALFLGDEDLALYAAANRLNPVAAKQRLRRQRQRGRTFSGCAALPEP